MTQTSWHQYGDCFKVKCSGNSHSDYMLGMVIGLPLGMKIDFQLLGNDLDRRRPTKHSTPRKEKDEVFFIEGVSQEGVVCQDTVTFRINNENRRREDYDAFKGLFRPSHVDYPYYIKYQKDDILLKAQASARTYLPVVVAGSLAKMCLKEQGINIHAEVEYFAEERLKQGDTLGGKILCKIEGIKAGLGSPLFDKIQAPLAYMMMCIPSVVSFEIGDGLQRIDKLGSEDIDPWNPDFTTQTNHSGGLNAGISNGMPIVFHVGFHPIHSLSMPMDMIDVQGNITPVSINGRHDKTQILRSLVMVENFAAVVIYDIIKKQIDNEQKEK